MPPQTADGMWHGSVNTTKHSGLSVCIVQQEVLIQLHCAHLKLAQPRHHGMVSAIQKFRVGITRACQRQKIAVPQDKLQITHHSITPAIDGEQYAAKGLANAHDTIKAWGNNKQTHKIDACDAGKLTGCCHVTGSANMHCQAGFVSACVRACIKVMQCSKLPASSSSTSACTSLQQLSALHKQYTAKSK